MPRQCWRFFCINHSMDSCSVDNFCFELTLPLSSVQCNICLLWFMLKKTSNGTHSGLASNVGCGPLSGRKCMINMLYLGDTDTNSFQLVLKKWPKIILTLVCNLCLCIDIFNNSDNEVVLLRWPSRLPC